MANGHGGARPGAGRKPKAQRFATKIGAADGALAAHLKPAVANLKALADGAIEQVEERWEPAGLVLIDSLEYDDDGKAVRTKKLAFPGLDPGHLVLVERRVSRTLPDRHANIYIINRIMGTPTPEPEPPAEEGDDDFQVDLSGEPDPPGGPPDGEPAPVLDIPS